MLSPAWKIVYGAVLLVVGIGLQLVVGGNAGIILAIGGVAGILLGLVGMAWRGHSPRQDAGS